MDVGNPATGDRIEYAEHTRAAIDSALAQATEAFDGWRERSLREREEVLGTAGDVHRENTRDYADLMTREMGIPTSQAMYEEIEGDLDNAFDKRSFGTFCSRREYLQQMGDSGSGHQYRILADELGPPGPGTE